MLRFRLMIPAPNGARLVEVTDSGPTPESACAQMEMEREVQRALNGLSFEHRVAVVLRDIEGLSYEEIAETLGLSLGTVKSRLWRARSEMKTKLESVLKSRSRRRSGTLFTQDVVDGVRFILKGWAMECKRVLKLLNEYVDDSLSWREAESLGEALRLLL